MIYLQDKKFHRKQIISISQHETTNIYTTTNINLFQAAHRKTDDFIQPPANLCISPSYVCDGLPQDVENRFVLPHTALTRHTKINTIVVSQHPTTRTCTDTNSSLFQAAHQDTDDVIQEILSRFISPSYTTHGLINIKDDASSEPRDSPASLIDEINMCTFSCDATSDMENKTDENIYEPSQLPAWIKQLKSDYDVVFDGYSKRIEEQKQILNKLIKEKEAIKNQFYETINEKLSQWIKKKTSRGKKKRIGQLTKKIH